eukprot:Clim_evm46s240 gene=Clim_evmTU46s240
MKVIGEVLFMLAATSSMLHTVQADFPRNEVVIGTTGAAVIGTPGVGVASLPDVAIASVLDVGVANNSEVGVIGITIPIPAEIVLADGSTRKCCPIGCCFCC